MKRYGWKIFDRCSQKLFSVNPNERQGQQLACRKIARSFNLGD